MATCAAACDAARTLMVPLTVMVTCVALIAVGTTH